MCCVCVGGAAAWSAALTFPPRGPPAARCPMAAMAPVWVNSCCALAAAAALVFFRVSSEQPTSECQTPASHCRQRDVHRLLKSRRVVVLQLLNQ